MRFFYFLVKHFFKYFLTFFIFLDVIELFLYKKNIKYLCFFNKNKRKNNKKFNLFYLIFLYIRIIDVFFGPGSTTSDQRKMPPAITLTGHFVFRKGDILVKKMRLFSLPRNLCTVVGQNRS